MARGIDHLVIAARDLDALADVYAQLGFRVGAQNRHPWGTINRIVQFDGCFLELISTEPGFQRPADDAPVAPFAGFLADYLATREGLAMLVLESKDAARDQAHFEAAGIAAANAPFFFERTGRRADGEAVHVAFSLAFARPLVAQSAAGFFVCQQHFPEAFWSPALQRHDNRVTSVAAVDLVVDGGAAMDGGWLQGLGAFTDQSAAAIPGGVSFDTGRGELRVIDTVTAARQLGSAAPALAGGAPGFCAITFAAPDIEMLAARMAGEGIPHDNAEGRLVVPASATCGVALVFAQAA